MQANAVGAFVVNENLPNVVAGQWIGNVVTNAGKIYNRYGAVWTGNVLANGGLIHNFSDGTWIGNVASNTGTIDNDGIWTGAFDSAGTIDNSGLLHLNGGDSAIATLINTGTISMKGGGAGQTLTATTANFGAGSFFDIDLTGAGITDKLVATTSATLDGTVRVSGLATSAGSFTTPYVIVSSPIITGVFAGVTTDLVFLNAGLNYDDPSAVALTLVRNSAALTDLADTPNQRAVAVAVQSLGVGNPIYDAMMWATNDGPAPQFDALSGEIYASGKGVFMQNAGVVADAAAKRIDQAFDAVDIGGAPAVSAYADAPALPAGPARNNGLWGQMYGSFANLAATGNTAALDSTTGGLVAGVDNLLGGWRLGVMVQAGATDVTVPARNSSLDSIDYGSVSMAAGNGGVPAYRSARAIPGTTFIPGGR